VETAFQCPRCGGLLDVAYDWDRLRPPRSLRELEAHWSRRTDPLSFSGVWRFHELLPFAGPEQVMTVGEGQTILQKADAVAQYVGLEPGHPKMGALVAEVAAYFERRTGNAAR